MAFAFAKASVRLSTNPTHAADIFLLFPLSLGNPFSVQLQRVVEQRGITPSPPLLSPPIWPFLGYIFSLPPLTLGKRWGAESGYPPLSWLAE